MLLSMRLKSREHIVDGEPGGISVSQHARHERPQAAFVLSRGMCLRRRGGNERSDAAPRHDDTGAFELRIHPCDRIRIDPESDRQLPDRRELVPGCEPSGSDGRPEPPLELRIDGRAVAGVDRDDVH